MHSPQIYAEEISGRRSSSSRASSSSSPAPLNDHHSNNGNGRLLQHRRSCDALTESIMSSNCHNNGNRISPGANPLTKNVGVSVNLGKPNVKSNSSSAAGAQHITPNGHQHQQQHTLGTMSVTPASTTVNSTNSHNSNDNNNSSNCAAINLGHGHIGTIAGPPSVSISSGLGQPASLSSSGVNHNSSLAALPAVNAPTTCANKGVPSSHNQLQQQQHLSNLIPTTSHPRMSPHSPNHGLTESIQTGTSTSIAELSNSSSSSSSSTSSSSRNGGNGNNKNNSGGIRTGPNSPSASSTASTSSCSGGSKGEAQLNVHKTNANGSTNASDGGCSSSSNNANRIVSQNVNGTLALTGVPSNECELQLFRVLQRANLLSYFDVMIELGGDDVQQLCEAGEEEFLEIMALIGMAAKPLHVRRLQKALQEWMTQPNLFQAPVLPPGYSGAVGNSSLQVLPQFVGATGVGQVPMSHLPYLPVPGSSPTGVPVFYPGVSTTPCFPTDPKRSLVTSFNAPNPNQSAGINHIDTSSEEINASENSSLQQTDMVNPQLAAAVLECLNSNPHNNQQRQRSQSRYQHSSSHHSSNSKNRVSRTKERNISKRVSSPLSISDIKIPVDQLIPSHFLETRIRTSSEMSSPVSSIAGSPHPEGRNSVSPVPLALQDHEIQKLSEAAIHHIRSLPPSVAEPKFSSKRKTPADYELILRLSENDPHRMEEVRRVAAVYGRADAKRKTLKPLSMHELAINEAASQLCKHVPALLTKREELLSLSRQVLRESGLPYAAVSSTFSIPILTNGFVNTAASNNVNSINNNDINTKSKYEEINRHHHHKSRDNAEGNSANIFGSVHHHAKRFRLDGPSGIEIQEYSNHSRPSSISIQEGTSSPSSSCNNGMQITELRCLPPRRSPSDDNLSSPLELVTVTSSDRRKSGIGSGASKSSSVSSIDSNSPPIRRPYSVESDDLSNSISSSFPQFHGIRVGHQELINAPPTVKVASIPVSGGSISILNHIGNTTCSPHHYSHRSHHQYSGNMKFMPIKSEPTVN